MTTADDGEGELPEMVTHNVTMLVSDSGVIRYKATTDLWVRYKPVGGEQYQYFPEGIYLEQMDSAFNPVASIEADTAYNYETSRRWHLINNVHIVNNEDEHFYTNDLHWDVNRHRVYSDSLIRIKRPDATLVGYGFRSDDRFTEYTIMNPVGDFPMQNLAKSDSAAGLHQAMMDSVRDASHQEH
jgi:LPS export ABC transporter protein LptC